MTQLLQNAVYGTVLILAVAVLRGALKDRLLPEARLALWAVCLFRLFTPAAPTSALSFWGLFGRGAREIPAPVVPVVPAPTTGPATAPNAGIIAPAAPTVATVPTAPVTPAETGTGVPWGAILAAVWIAVGLILAARYALAYVRTRRAVGYAIPLGREDARYAALPKCARLREGPMEGAPLTFGVARPTVVLFPGLEGSELACVLAHEGVHARRRDNLWHYAAAAALTVFWWNPAVWLMARLIRRDVELSCDRAAVRRLGADRRAEYAAVLVTLSTQAEGGAFCHGFGPKRTKERIIAVMKYKKATVTGIALTLALVLAVTVGFASNPGAGMPDGESTDSPAPATLIYEYVPSPVDDDFVRVNVPESGFYYDMPADGWNPYGAYFLYSAYGTDSQVEIYGTGAGGFVGEVELYESLGYTKTEETDGLTVLAWTEILEFRDGTVLTARYEVYVYGQKGPGQCWVVSLKWIEENLTGETANEPEIMRAIARSFTITTDLQKADQGGADAGDQTEMYICTREDCGNNSVHEHDGVMYKEWRGKISMPAPPLCTREDCPHQPSVHYHDWGGGGVVYVYNEPNMEGDEQDEPPICQREDCPIQPSIHWHNEDGSVSYISNDLPSMVVGTVADDQTEEPQAGVDVYYDGTKIAKLWYDAEKGFWIDRETGEEYLPDENGYLDTDDVVKRHTDNAQDDGPIACPPDAIDKDFYQKYGDSHH